MLDKINVIPIIRKHTGTLRDYSTDTISKTDVFLFYFFPAIVAGYGLYVGWTLTVDALNAALAAFAIFAGLLLNLLILVYTFSTGTNHPNELAKVRQIVLRELHANISYSVVVSVLIVIIDLVAIAHLRLIKPAAQETVHADPYVTSALIYLTVNFALTLLMILKRIHVMLSNQLDQPVKRNAA